MENQIPDEATSRQQTFGDALVGRSFNPSKNPKVDRLKDLFAEAADIVKEEQDRRNQYMRNAQDPNTKVSEVVFGAVYQVILDAQMCTVKAVTLPE